MDPIQALFFRLRQASRLQDAERRVDALEQALGQQQQHPTAPAAALSARQIREPG